MPSINLNHEYPEINQADANALAIGALNGVLKSDGANGFSVVPVDAAPTASSTNLVESGGVKAAIDAAVQTAVPKRTEQNDPANSSFSVLCDTAISGQAKPKLYGKSVVINQFCGNETPTSVNDLTVTYVNGKLTVTGTASANTNLKLADNSYLPTGHTVALLGSPTGAAQGAYGFYFSTSGDWVIGDTIRTYSNGLGSFNLRVVSGQTVNISCYPMFIDLTAIFGSDVSSITDAATLKTAWLKKFGYPLPAYIPYNQGSIVSNNATYQLMGRNLWDEEYLLNSDIDANGNATSGSRLISKNFIPIKPSTDYYIYGTAAGAQAGNLYTCPYYYDANKTFISGGTFYANGVQTSPPTACYMKFKMATAVTAYNHDICINLSDASFNGTYETWYDGGSVTADSLNGFDGTSVQDTQDADGQEVRKCGEYTFTGSETWSNHGTYAWSIKIPNTPNAGAPSDYTAGNIIVSGKVTVPWQTLRENPPSGVVALGMGKEIAITAADYSAGERLVGRKIVYQLLTPTTGSTSPSDIQTQNGYNSLDPVSGDVQSADASVEYPVDIIAYIDKKLAEL